MVKFLGKSNHGHIKITKFIVFGILGVLVLIFILCACCCCFFKDSSESSSNDTMLSNIEMSLEEPDVTMGLDEATIESYKTIVLGEGRSVPQPNDGKCPICLSKYKEKEKLRIIPGCNHCFHVGCIDEWLRSNTTCPVCRNNP